MDDKDVIESWRKHYETHVGLYKHHLELLVKFNIFYFAVTGAILSFYFSHTSTSNIKYSLLFPVLMSIGFGILFFYVAPMVNETQKNVDDIVKALHLVVSPELRVLKYVLWLFGLLMLTVAACLALLFLGCIKVG